MMPKDKGKAAAPSPWIARLTTSVSILGERADTSDPTAMAPSATSSVRTLPVVSPIRPRIGVATADDSRNAMMTQATAP